MTKSLIQTNRRRFLRGTAASIAAFSFFPGHVLGLHGATSPNNKLNLACIGIGGRGGDDINELTSENIVALCDVDAKQGGKNFERFPEAKRYQDFRKMLDEMDKQIDAVLVATADHTHAVALMKAIKMRKHVYSEKPLAHSIHEIRTIMAAARIYKVTTQLGNQGHSFDSIRQFKEWVADGAIGTVREIHAFCGNSYSRMDRLDQIKQNDGPAPDTLNWDLWLGPAQYRPFNPAYVPGKWRGWMPFGTGIIGDWTCHVVDPVFWTLDLGAPTTIEAETGDYDPIKHADTFPKASIVRYEFPARGARPAVKLTWYDGTQRPARPEELEKGKELPSIGALVEGDKGKILYGSHGAAGLRILPESRRLEYKEPAHTIPKSPGHHKEWIDACKGGKPAGSNFDYGGPLAEIALLGIIAIRMKGKKLKWDSKSVKFTNCDEANALLNPPYRKGWSL